jgi:hypothetical protein
LNTDRSGRAGEVVDVEIPGVTGRKKLRENSVLEK